MTPIKEQIEDFLRQEEVKFEPHSQSAREHVEERWRLAFAQNVKKTTGAWVHKRFRWHGFSFEFQKAITGAAALNAYRSQWAAPYVLFDEEGHWSYDCTSGNYPDFTSFAADIYVAHHNMKWTMAFTHEQPDIGPFFAEATANRRG